MIETGNRTSHVVEQVFREASAQAVATLARTFGDIALAEDAVQEAFIVAGIRWTEDGMPPNPVGWIITTARRRAIDQLRRSARGRERLECDGGALRLVGRRLRRRLRIRRVRRAAARTQQE